MIEDNNYKRLLDDCKKYIRLRFDMLRLELLEKTSRILAVILLAIIGAFLVIASLIYFSLALVAALQPTLGSVVPLCIVGGLFLLILLVLILLRKYILINPIIAQLSKIIFRDCAQNSEDDEQEDENN